MVHTSMLVTVTQGWKLVPSTQFHIHTPNLVDVHLTNEVSYFGFCVFDVFHFCGYLIYIKFGRHNIKMLLILNCEGIFWYSVRCENGKTMNLYVSPCKQECIINSLWIARYGSNSTSYWLCCLWSYDQLYCSLIVHWIPVRFALVIFFFLVIMVISI